MLTTIILAVLAGVCVLNLIGTILTVTGKVPSRR